MKRKVWKAKGAPAELQPAPLLVSETKTFILDLSFFLAVGHGYRNSEKINLRTKNRLLS